MAVTGVVLDVMRNYKMGTLNEDEFDQPFVKDPLDPSEILNSERWFNFYYERMINQVERECGKVS